jgi:two-component system cell cycle sensor histidine kinase/response regulator CckA
LFASSPSVVQDGKTAADSSISFPLRATMAPRDTHSGLPPEGASDPREAPVDAEERLRESQALLVKALDVGHIGAWRHDLSEGGTLWWSPETYRIFGIAPGDAIDVDRFFDAVHPDDRSQVRAATSRAVTERIPYATEHRIIRPDGVECWVRERAEVVCDEAGTPVRLVGVVQNITESRTIEHALRSSEERLRAIVAEMPVLMNAFDEEGRLVFWNHECERVTGYSASEVLQDPNVWARLYPDAGYLDRMMREWRTRGNSYRDWEWTLTCKDGSTRTIAWSNLSDRCEIPGWASWGIGVDVTERKRLEQQFLQAQKMEAVGRLAGGIAHDFNNLLTVIAGYTEVVLGELPAGTPHRAALEQVRRAGERAAALTRQLLLFTRRQIVEARVVDLNHVVRDMERMLRRLIGEDIELVIAPAHDGAPVRVDPGQIEQVLLNLAVNARDAMPSGGRLTIETSHVTLAAHQTRGRSGLTAGGHVLLRVVDSGIGMDPMTLGRIFEPFFTTKGPGHGTGLGLATVFGIVQQNRGHIEAASTRGVGSTFTIFLPRVTEPITTATAARTGRSPVTGDETILLVEDDDDVRELAREGLMLRGYKVLDVRDGSEAFLLSQGFQGVIHLVVTDVVMPNMNGPQAAELIRLHRPSIKVLFMSGYTGDLPFPEGPNAPPRVLLEKPFTIDALTRKVRDVLDA